MSALVALGWATLSEEDLIKKTAANIRRKGLTWKRPFKGDIRMIVADTLPARGQRKSRLERVLKEMDRQNLIQGKRAEGRPKWRRRKSKDERKVDLALARGINVVSCYLLKQLQGHLFLIVRDEDWNRKVIILKDRKVCFQSSVFWNCTTFFGFVEHLHGKRFKEVMAEGARVRLDIESLTTIVEYQDGSVERWSWEVAAKGK